MTYVTLHGTLTNIEKGSIGDGHISTTFILGSRDTSWNFEKSFKNDAENVLVDGNYFSEKDGGICPWKMTKKDRKFIHDKYLALIDIIKEQLDKNGRFDIDLLGYFEPEGADMEWCSSRLRTVIENISRGCIKTNALITIMNALDDAGY